MRRNMLIGQSGGPTVAINASLSGAIKRAMKTPEIGEIYGAINALEGALKGKLVNLKPLFKCQEDFERLEATPAMVLGSCRYKLPSYPDAVYEQFHNVLKQHDIGFFLYIGGNDSMDTILKLSDYFKRVGEDIRCVGIPKTIDNDLPGTDHTPGFGSAALYIATSTAEIACDSSVYDLSSISIMEIMGRNAGWLTAASALARRKGCSAPHLIYLPEVPFYPDDFIIKIREVMQKERNVVIAVSEGIRLANGEYVSAAEGKVDAFGHQALAGVGKYLEHLIQQHIDCKVRSIEMNILQRSASHLRSSVDIEEACRIGAEAVTFAANGATGIMAGFRRISDFPYLVSYESIDIRDVANREKKVPLEWISQDGCDITDDMLVYLRPLISQKNSDAIPEFFSIEP